MGRDIYRYLVSEGFDFLQFIPCVEYDPVTGEPTPYNVSPLGYGRFLTDVFDVWYERDVGRVNVRTFESLVGRFAGVDELGVCTMGNYCDHYLVVEKEGDVYPCDFFVDPKYNLGSIMETPLVDLYVSDRERAFSQIKGRYAAECRTCRWLDLCFGGCPKDRLCGGGGSLADRTPLCEGLKFFYDHTAERLRSLAETVRMERAAAVRDMQKASAGKVGRNDPCPCGSGKKYKRCCMK